MAILEASGRSSRFWQGLHPLDILARGRGRLFPLAPVLLSLGIASYFAWPDEPSRASFLAAGGTSAVALLLWMAGPERWQPVAAAVALAVGGFWLSVERAHDVAGPVMSFRYYGPIEGRIVEIDRSGKDRIRLTLDSVVLQRTDPARTPLKVRVSLLEDQPHLKLEPGLRVMTTGHLGPPGRPVEPGGFDFRRVAWFEGLGALGYTRNPVMVLAPQDGRADLMLSRLRAHLAAGVRAAIPGDAGGFAAAVTTGDRSGISAHANETMRASNLSHILSISGMHMGMLAGFVFLVLRYGLALIPWIALRVPVKKIAAAIALAAATFYLALAGRDVATERSYIMVAMMLVSVLFDRRALSLRSVALAAMVVLMLRPESLLSPGFQMSFAATVALVTTFGWMSGWTRPWPGWVEPGAIAVISSFVAGTATIAYSAATFNRIAQYGLAANLLATPAMGVLVMPGAVIAGVLAPFGLAGPVLWAVGIGSRWVLWVAEVIAGLGGAVSPVPTPPGWIIPVMTLAGIWIVMVPGRARWCGGVPVAVALLAWTLAERPGLLIAESGGLSGVMTPDGRAISKPTGDTFAVESWLQSDGDLADPASAALRGGVIREKGVARYAFAGRDVIHLTGKGAADAVAKACRPGRIVITSAKAGKADGGCILFDATRLARTGAVALQDRGGDLVVKTVAKAQGDRLWTR